MPPNRIIIPHEEVHVRAWECRVDCLQSHTVHTYHYYTMSAQIRTEMAHKYVPTMLKVTHVCAMKTMHALLADLRNCYGKHGYK